MAGYQTPDSAGLREAVRLLDERGDTRQQLPGPSVEFARFEVARLLDAIADSLERHEPVAAPVVEAATRVARHVVHYSDTYYPTHEDRPRGG